MNEIKSFFVLACFSFYWGALIFSLSELLAVMLGRPRFMDNEEQGTSFAVNSPRHLLSKLGAWFCKKYNDFELERDKEILNLSLNPKLRQDKKIQTELKNLQTKLNPYKGLVCDTCRLQYVNALAFTLLFLLGGLGLMFPQASLMNCLFLFLATSIFSNLYLIIIK